MSVGKLIYLLTIIFILQTFISCGGKIDIKDYQANSGSNGPDDTSNILVNVIFRQQDAANNRTYFNSSSNGGGSFQGATLIDAANENTLESPQIILDENKNPHVLFNQLDGANYRIYYNSSIDKGTSFQGVTIIDAGAGNSSYKPQISLDSTGNPHVVFSQWAGANTRVYYNYSADGGTSFQGATIIDANTGNNAYKPHVKVDKNGNPHIVFYQVNGPNSRIYYNYSTDGGTSFQGAYTIDTASGNNTNNPKIAIDNNNNPHVVFLEWTGSNTSIFYNYSNNEGVSFQGANVVDTGAVQEATDSQIVVSEIGNPHIVLVQSDGSNNRIYYNYSNNGGVTFQGTSNVDAGVGNNANSPQIKVDKDGNPHIVFVQSDGSNDRIYYNYSNDGGVTFQNAYTIDTGAGNDASSPQIEVDDNGNPYVVFVQSDGSNSRLYYNYSNNGGTYFRNAILIDAGAGNNSSLPQIAIISP